MRRILPIVLLLFALIASGFPGPFHGAAQNQVYTDSMDSAATGLLSTDSSDPTVSFAYQDGQYFIESTESGVSAEFDQRLLVPEMGSSRLTVETAVGGDPNGKYVMAGCRASGENDGYALAVFPASGYIALYREDAGESVVLASELDSPLVNRGQAANQIGIDCTFNIITGIVNGQSLFGVFDDTYTFGSSYIGAGAGGDQADGLLVAFDNLSLTDFGNIVLGDVPPTADPGSMVPIPDPTVDPAGALSAGFAISLQQPPAMADGGGDVTIEFGQHAEYSAGVELASFYTEVSFLAPQVPAGTIYQVGFSFWADSLGNDYLIWIEDDGTGNAHWGYASTPVSGTEQLLQSGAMPPGSIDPTPGAENFLSLMVYEGVAILSGSTYSVGVVIPLQGNPVAGNITSDLYYFPLGDTTVAPPLSMSTSDFAVWDLSSGLAPAS